MRGISVILTSLTKELRSELLLDTLPNVGKMKAFLADSANKSWLLGRMPSQAALDVLHWVDASTAPLS
jgi:ubiquitin-conjugating enzyme E2 Q